MKKIGVFTDTHGNLLALKVMLDYFEKEGCEEILHLGDVIDIGPHSKQCFDIITQHPNITCILGNHDRNFVLRDPISPPLSHVPTEHKLQVFATLTEADRQIAEKFPLYVTRKCGGQTLLFCHYPFFWKYANSYLQNEPYMFIEQNQTAQNFDDMMPDYDGIDAVFFGHKHERADAVGKRTYVNVGSLGCHPGAFAQGVVIEYDDNGWTYRRVELDYDMEQTHQDMQDVACGEHLYNFYFLRKKP